MRLFAVDTVSRPVVATVALILTDQGERGHEPYTRSVMTVAWAQVSRDAPGLAALAQDVLVARRMKTLATLRRDGSPRLSEISGAFVRDGELWLGLIPSAKEGDLVRDPRCGVHCGSPTDDFGASARVTGRAIRADAGDAERLGIVRGDPPRFSLFRLDIGEVVVTRPEPETGLILVEWWTPEGGFGRLTREGG